MTSLLFAVVLSAAPGTSPRLKLALPLPVAVRIDQKDAEFFAEHLAQQMALPQVDVVTTREISAMLGMERQKQLMGCSSDSCVAELAAALGADGMVLVSFAKIDDATQVELKIISATNGSTLATFSDRVTSQQAVLEALDRGARQILLQTFRATHRDVPAALVSANEPATAKLWWVPGVAGVLVAGAGVGVYLWAQSDYKSLTTPNAAHLLTDSEAKGFRDAGSSKESAGVVCMIVGAAAIVASAALLTYSKVSANGEIGMVGLLPLPDGAAFVLSGTFP